MQLTVDQGERIARIAPDLLSVCHELHALLWHYDLARQPNGVDWGSPNELKEEYIKKLETIFAQVEETP